MELNPVFARRLYLLYLIDSLERPDVPTMMKKTTWPRRTIQDALLTLSGFGVLIQFVEDGVRHNHGFYQVVDWGPLDAKWIRKHHKDIFHSINALHS